MFFESINGLSATHVSRCHGRKKRKLCSLSITTGIAFMYAGKRFESSKTHHLNKHRSAAPAPRQKAPTSSRARGGQVNLRLPFIPPEDWHEPHENGGRYRFKIQPPGEGYRHVLTLDEVRERLAKLPDHFLRPLEIIQFSRMTRKKQSFPCYGMQWGAALYLYPIEVGLVEYYNDPPKPNQVNEARMYGGEWERERGGSWKLTWTEESIKDFYLNNILIHELGHLLDDRNSRSVDRERYAEHFAIKHGYLPTQAVRRARFSRERKERQFRLATA